VRFEYDERDPALRELVAHRESGLATTDDDDVMAASFILDA
jgi:hypothetical protein